jgi:hypothetical protein
MSTPVDTRQREVTKYQRAAHESLDQLAWCVNLLYRLGKPQIARAIEANYRNIRQQVREIES